MSTVDTQAISLRTNQLISPAPHGELVTAEQEGKAVAHRDLNRALQKQIHETFDPHIAQANQQHKALIRTRKEFLEPLEQSEQVWNRQLVDYRKNLERARRAEQLRLQQIADKEAETAALEKAAALEAAGEIEAAEHVLAVESEAPPVVLPPVAKPDGLSYRTTWHGKVTDATKLERRHLMPNQKAIDADARAFKADANMPGIQVYSKTTPVGRR